MRGIVVNSKIGLACGASLAALMTAGAAFAAPTDPASASTSVQEVVVTATKKVERLHDAALAVSALGNDDVQRRIETDFQGFAAQVPGLTVSTSGAGFNRLTLRGEDTGGVGAIVGLVLDDMPFNYSSGNVSGASTNTSFSPYDIQRIEVLRGPQGTLYGAGAEGGLIKYVTNKPSFASFAAGIETGVQNVDHGQTAGNVKGYINIPVNDTLALRASFTDEALPGWINNPTTGQKAVNSGVRSGGRITALWIPTKDLTITAQVGLQSQRQRGGSGVDVYGSELSPNAPPANATSPVNGFSFLSPTQQYSTNPAEYFYVDVGYDLHFAKFTSITSYSVQGSKVKSDTSGTEYDPSAAGAALGAPFPIYGITYTTLLAGYYGKPINGYEYNAQKLYKYTQEFRLGSEPGDKLFNLPVEWQVGFMGTRESTNWLQTFEVVSAAKPNGPSLSPELSITTYREPYNEFAEYADATVHFTPKFDIEAGLRHSDIRQGSQSVSPFSLLTAGSINLPRVTSTEGVTTYSVAPRYHFDKDTVAYLRIATGYRPGGPTLPLPNEPAGYPQSYHSDSTTNYEVGFRTYLFDKTVSIDTAAFYIDWKNIQVTSVYLINNTPYTVEGNAATATSQGLEWNLGWTPVKGLQLGLIGAVIDAKLTADASGIGGKKGDKLYNVPNFSNTLNVDYNHHAFGDYNFFAGGTWSYTGESYSGFIAPGSMSVLGNRVKLPGYSTVNLQGGLQNVRYTFELFVHNLGNERALLYYTNSGYYNGVVFPNGSPATFGYSTGGYGQGYFTQPRAIGFRIAAKL